MLVWILLLFIICSASSKIPEINHDYDKEVIPRVLPDVTESLKSSGKHIPRKIWIAVKDSKDELPGHMKRFLERNKLWEVTVCDNKCKDEFMNTTFAGTSALWAYNRVNPLVGAARADI